MTARRGKGEGSIFQSNGRWVGSIDLGWHGGKRKRKTIYAKTRREVVEKLRVLQRDRIVLDERQTVGQFTGHWLEEIIKPNVRASTYGVYERRYRLHINPAIGHIQLTKLTVQDVQAMMAGMKAKGLNASIIQGTRMLLKRAMRQAMAWDQVVRNVVDLSVQPRIEQRTYVYLDTRQARRLLDAACGDRLEALWRVGLSLGLRRGEMLGLRWQDIDLDARRLHVRVALLIVDGKRVLAEPKTATSLRTIALPPALVVALREHQLRQVHERGLSGADWTDHGMVFTTRRGWPMLPGTLRHHFKALLTRADLPDMRIHDLRHSCASLLAAQGIGAKMVQATLGHANINTTLNIYVHLFDEAKDEVAEAMERALDVA